MSNVSEDCYLAVARFQNLLVLTKQLNLPVSFKVRRASGADEQARYLIVVHVMADYSFRKYFKEASQSDMELFRGMFLSVTMSHRPQLNSGASSSPTARAENVEKHLKSIEIKASKDVPTFATDAASCAPVDILQFGVLQAFLPKFENEGQDASISDAIEKTCDNRYMAVSVKHSGSLCTISHELMGAKNSISNLFTSAGVLALDAHYKRVLGSDEAVDTKISCLLQALRSERLSVSFEVVTRCTGHHGQLPTGEYLVTTSMTHLSHAGRIQVLPWRVMMQFCVTHQLPTNDIWLFASCSTAASVRTVLDDAATSGAATHTILSNLDSLIPSHPANVKLTGTYPHDQWQGSRLEGFVISQGDPVSPTSTSQLQRLADEVRRTCVPISSVDSTSQRIVQQTLTSDAPVATAAASVRPSLAHVLGDWDTCTNEERDEVIDVLRNCVIPLSDDLRVRASAFGVCDAVVSRAALNSATDGELTVFSYGDAALQDLIKGGDSQPREKQVSLWMNHAAGSLTHTTSLRYKKKMTMIGDEVGYCLMTFVLRNGLPTLRQSREAYMAYVFRLVSRWGLSDSQVQTCVEFASAWASWVAQQGLVLSAHQTKVGEGREICSDSYLDQAELFVSELLSGVLPQEKSSQFRGVLVLVGLSSACENAVCSRLGIRLHVQTNAAEWQNRPADKLARSGIAISQGCQVGIENRSSVKDFWVKVAADTLVVHRPLSQELLRSKDSSHRKTVGLYNSKVTGVLREVTAYTKKSGLDQNSRILELSDYPLRALESPSTNNASEQSGSDQVKSCQASDATGDSDRPFPSSRTSNGEGGPARKKHAHHPTPVQLDSELSEESLKTVCDRITAWAGNGPAARVQDAAVVVLFLGVPGLGKTTLAQALKRELDSCAHVVHAHSDELKSTRNYWGHVAGAAVTHRADGRPTIVIADKNCVNSPRGNWANVAATLQASRAKVVAVVMTDDESISHMSDQPSDKDDSSLAPGQVVMPFTMSTLALGLQRVAARKQHPGDLTRSKTCHIHHIVASFATAFRGMSLAAVLQEAGQLFTTSLPLPVMHSGACLAPPEAAAHLSHGLLGNGFQDKASWGTNADAWERGVDTHLESYDYTAHAVPVDTAINQLLVAVQTELCSSTAPSDLSRHVRFLTTRYIAVDINHADTLALAFMSMTRELRVDPVPLKDELHVTLWHRLDQSSGDEGLHSEMLKRLLEREDEEVAVVVTGVDFLVCEEALVLAAARVDLENAPEPAYEVKGLHITLFVGVGYSAKDSQRLPGMLAAGDAGVRHVTLPDQAPLIGVIKATR